MAWRLHPTVDMMTPMPHGVVVTQRVQTAGLRAIASHERVGRLASKLSKEMDEMTGPVRAGSQNDFYDEEDSLVVVVSDVLARNHK